jgi:predicted nucleic acid-binding protein
LFARGDHADFKLVYAYDLADPKKHTIARELLEQLSNQGRLVWSTQVFNEFCEDFQDGRDVEDVLFVNPFRAPPK